MKNHCYTVDSGPSLLQRCVHGAFHELREAHVLQYVRTKSAALGPDDGHMMFDWTIYSLVDLCCWEIHGVGDRDKYGSSSSSTE